MSTHTAHTKPHTAYFCTVTCYNWLPLFEEANAYDEVYNWFTHLAKNNCYVLGYVIMPNHLHALLYPREMPTLNKLVGEGKRFMAYGIISKLSALSKTNTVEELSQGVRLQERAKGKKHQVFRLSFDARECFTERMVEQKLDYIHHNPVSGKWRLVEDFTDYKYSSASFYERGKKGFFDIVHYKELNATSA